MLESNTNTFHFDANTISNTSSNTNVFSFNTNNNSNTSSNAIASLLNTNANISDLVRSNTENIVNTHNNEELQKELKIARKIKSLKSFAGMHPIRKHLPYIHQHTSKELKEVKNNWSVILSGTYSESLVVNSSLMLRTFTKCDIERKSVQKSLETWKSANTFIATSGQCAMSGALGLPYDSIPNNSSYFPRLLAPLSFMNGNIMCMASGELNVGVITDDYKVFVWGGNEFSQLGINPMNMPDLDMDYDANCTEEEKCWLKKQKLNPPKYDGRSDERDDGKSDGKDDGKSDGKDDGGSDGKDDGKSDGKDDGKSDGKDKKNKREDEYQSSIKCTYYTPALLRMDKDIRVTQICFGECHTVLLDDNGRVYSCGTFRIASIGEIVGHHINPNTNEIIRYQRTPDLIPEQKQFIIQIASASNNILMLDKNGDIWQMGIDTDLILVRIESQVKFRKIVCGNSHYLAISVTNLLYAWGNNRSMQCGFESKIGFVKLPTLLPFHTKALEKISDRENKKEKDTDSDSDDSDDSSNDTTDIEVRDVCGGGRTTIVLDTHGNVWTCGTGASGLLVRLDADGEEIEVDDVLRIVPSFHRKIDWIGCGSHAWFAHNKYNGAVYAYGMAEEGQTAVGAWHSARGRPVFDDLNLDMDNYEVVCASGGSSHCCFMIKKKLLKKSRRLALIGKKRKGNDNGANWKRKKRRLNK